MYISDADRRTLTVLQRTLDDPTAPTSHKRKAAKTKSEITARIHDKKYAHLKHSLDKAVKANDKWWIYVYTCEIKKHLNEPIPDDIYAGDPPEALEING